MNLNFYSVNLCLAKSRHQSQHITVRANTHQQQDRLKDLKNSCWILKNELGAKVKLAGWGEGLGESYCLYEPPPDSQGRMKIKGGSENVAGKAGNDTNIILDKYEGKGLCVCVYCFFFLSLKDVIEHYYIHRGRIHYMTTANLKTERYWILHLLGGSNIMIKQRITQRTHQGKQTFYIKQYVACKD